ncbi:MAG: recombinase family protein [Candidatus Aenigmarchaeota archaeon]|nr:recombinase family protein [Candidatus Aenigmarchaeota archaeon]
MKTAAIYTRVSTTRQKEEGTSLETQLERCLALAKAKGYEVPDEFIFKEDYSGATLDRPLLMHARLLLKEKKIDAFIVHSTDRLARNPIHIAIIAEECEKRKVELIFVTEPLDNTPEGQLIRYVIGYAAQIEKEKILERTTRGKKMRALRGKIPSAGHTSPYGYRYIPGRGDGEGIRAIVPENAEVVKKIYSWLVEEGLTLNAIVRRLRDLGIPSPSGKETWIKSTVHRVLTNPAYTGKTYAFTMTPAEPKRRLKSNPSRLLTSRAWRPRDEWIEVPGATPAIITEELFNSVQKQLQRNSELAKRNSKHQYLFSGYVYCKWCGRRYWGMPKKKVPSYACAAKQHIDFPTKCRNRTYSAARLERLVWERLEEAMTNPDFVYELLRRRQETLLSGDSAEEDLKTIDAMLDKLRNREVRLIRLYSFGEFDDDLLQREKASIEIERKRLLSEKEVFEQRLKNLRRWQLDEEGIKSLCNLVLRRLQEFSFEARRLLLETLQLKVWIDGDSVELEAILPILARDQLSSHYPDRMDATLTEVKSDAVSFLPLKLSAR